jgi:hypothetical protein
MAARASRRFLIGGLFWTLLISASLSTGARAYDDDVTKWPELPDRFAIRSIEGAERWYRLGLWEIDWRVYVKGGQVRAALISETAGLETPTPDFWPEVGDYQFLNLDTYLRVDDGWLISFRRGEWGGGLYWFSPDGKANQYLGGLQVNQFLRVDDEVLAVEGLSHLGSSNGSLVELSHSGINGEWRYKTLKRMPRTPYAFVRRSDGTLLIVLLDSVVSLTAEGELSTVMVLKNWDGIAANSLALVPDDAKAYLGGRGYISELNFNEQVVRYLAPTQIVQQLISGNPVRLPEHRPQALRFRLPAPDPGLQ